MILDVLSAAAKVGEGQIAEIITEEARGGTIQEGPQTFEEMLDTGIGNFLQRVTKVYIKPRNLEQTIKLMKTLQVDHFQEVVIGIHQLIKKALRLNKRIQTNYTLGDNSLNSMVDFATNQTTFNEAVYLVGAGLCAALALPAVAAGYVDSSFALNTGLFVVNVYCILAQRYTRARLSRAINQALKLHKEFDINKYSNVLGIKTPNQPQTSNRE